MNHFNAIVLHQIVQQRSKSFIDVTIKTLHHILMKSKSKGELLTIDQASLKPNISGRAVCITFDDGFSSDHDLVLPELKKIGAKATFFIVTDWLNKPGYLTEKQVRNLSEEGMQIGSHSKSHPNFLNITAKERIDELRLSKQTLENIIDKEISTFSFPFGFYDDSCVQSVFDANYKICCTSKHGLSSCSNPIVPRNSINANTSLHRIDNILKATLVQRILWYLEDVVKENLKHSFPRLYKILRDRISNY